MSKLTCKFCGFDLVSGVNQRYIVPDRRQAPIGHGGQRCNEGECLNRAGYLTKHHPDAPEFNGGIDYSDRRSRFEGVPA